MASVSAFSPTAVGDPRWSTKLGDCIGLRCESVAVSGEMCPKEKDLSVYMTQNGIEVSKSAWGYMGGAQLDQCPATYKMVELSPSPGAAQEQVLSRLSHPLVRLQLVYTLQVVPDQHEGMRILPVHALLVSI